MLYAPSADTTIIAPDPAPPVENRRRDEAAIVPFDAAAFERELAAAPSPITPFRALLKHGDAQFKDLFLQGAPALSWCRRALG